MKMSSLILANPAAGRGKGARILAETLEYLENQRLRYRLIAASSLKLSLDELRRQDSAQELNEHERVFVIGGDGMVHHAINLLHNKIPIGVIPAGTGNDFARALGLNVRNPVRNIEKFLTTEPATIDLGEVNGVKFGAICSTGFDSMVNERANAMSWPKGKRKYDIAMVQELPRFKPRRYSISIDGQTIEAQAMLIAVGNGSSYGGGMKVCPNASLFDGQLDVMILHPVPKVEFLRIFPKVYSGTHIQHPQVQMLRGREIKITGEAITYADGERISPTPVTIRSLSRSLNTWYLHERD